MASGLEQDLKDRDGLIVQPSLAPKPVSHRYWPIELLGNAGSVLICAGGAALLAFDGADLGSPLFIAGMFCILAAAILNEIVGGDA